jgi:hypothetical protein
MHRTSFALVLTAWLAALSETAHAADTGVGGAPADPFAPAPEPRTPSVEEQEAAVLGAPAQPSPAEAPPPAPVPAPRRPPAGPRTRQTTDANTKEVIARGDSGKRGVAIELSTAGFASGALVGGLFVGARSAGSMIVGGFLDYGLASVSLSPEGSPQETSSAQFLRLGVGLRPTLATSADGIVDLYGAADASFNYQSAEVVSSGMTTPTTTVSATGFSMALGPGLRFWLHERIAIGYVARLRMTYLTGEAGVFQATATDSPTDASATTIGFDGTFQILGVF